MKPSKSHKQFSLTTLFFVSTLFACKPSFESFNDKLVEKNGLYNQESRSTESQGSNSVEFNKPNIIFIVIDSLRGDIIGNYGVTPNLENLQKSAVTFQNHLVNSSWTRPSTIVFFTGKYASRSPVNLWDYATPKEEAERFKNSISIKLPEILTKNGYFTKMIGNNPFVTEKNGLGVDCGFEEVQDFSMYSNDTPKITEATLRFFEIEKSKKDLKPFFLFLNFNDPHKPYTPPEEHVSRIKTTEELVLQKKNYLGEVSFVDSELGKIFAKLKEMDLWENSVILITADHGEVMNPKHAISLFTGTDTYFGHGSDLLLENVHVPFLLKLQNQKDSQFVTERTQSVDFLPTLLSVAQIPKSKNESWDGWDLTPLVKKTMAGEEWKSRPYYGETRFTQGISIGDGWILQRSYRFHKKGPFWESLVVGKEPLYYYNTMEDPLQENPMKFSDQNEIETLKSENLKSTIGNLIFHLRKIEPSISEYFVRFGNPKTDANFPRDLQLTISTDAGELRLVSGTPDLVRKTPKQWTIEAKSSSVFSFNVYPDIVFPKIQVTSLDKKSVPLSFGVGAFGIRPDACKDNCEALWDSNQGEPKIYKDLLVHIWRKGGGIVLSSGKTEYSVEALDILKKQGYVQ